MICRECIYYINLRQAYLLSPNYSKRLSSRTVLFTCIPEPYLDESKLRRLFGDSVKNVWIPRNTRQLRALVKDRQETAERLERAEVRLITIANSARARFLKRNPASTEKLEPASTATSPTLTQDDSEKGKADTFRFTEHPLSSPVTPLAETPTTEAPPDPEYMHPYGLAPTLPDVRGSVAAMWIPAEARPHHRPLANFGRRVDTIRWTRARLKVLNRDIWKLRRKHRGGDGSPLNAAFVEFDTQVNAQAGYQILTHHQPLHMSPSFIGMRPEDVVWSSLRIKWWEHIMRRFFMMAAIAAAIIFWSIPSVLVGTVSNIKSLTGLLPFLDFLLLIPSPILGVLQGLLPALALSWLMALVPRMLRGMHTAPSSLPRALTSLIPHQPVPEWPAFRRTRWWSFTYKTPTFTSRSCRSFSSPQSPRLRRRQ